MKLTTVFYYVRDMDRAVQFYTEVLGLPLEHRFGDNWAEVNAGPVTVGLHPVDEHDTVVAGGGGTASFTVENIEDVVKQLRERGATVGEIHERPRGKFAMVTDPDGNHLHFIEFSERWKKANSYG